jgi:hypothetical protein
VLVGLLAVLVSGSGFDRSYTTAYTVIDIVIG